MSELTNKLQKSPKFDMQTLIIGVLLGITAVFAGLIIAYGTWLAAAAIVLISLGAYVVLRDMEIGFYGTLYVICLLPFGTLPIDIGVTPTLLDCALGATIGIWLLRLVTGRQTNVVTSPIIVPLVLFILIAIFAFIFGLSNGPLTANLLRHFAELLLSIGFVIVIIDYCRTWERLEKLVKVFLIAGAGCSFLAILLWLLPEEVANDGLNLLRVVGYPEGWVIRYIEENPAFSERAIGTSVDPNALGGLLAMVGALAVPQLVAKRPLFSRRIAVFINLLIFVAIILTFSRGAMVGFLAGVGFIVAIRYRGLIPYAIPAAMLLLILPFSQEYLLRFVEGFQGQDLATQMRFGEYKDALISIRRYPIFGVGFAGAPDLDIYLAVAMVYLAIAQQMGLLGLLSFFSVIVTLFSLAYFKRNVFKDNPTLDPIWLGLLASIVSGLVIGVFDHYIFNLDFHHAVTAFWFLIGLSASATRLGSPISA